MGMGPTSQELPNQLVLQTGHRNGWAKHPPWTPNATNVASGLAAQTCQFDRALYQPGMVLLPRWNTEPKDSPNQPPTIIYKTAAKEINRPRSQDNTPGGQFGPQVNQKRVLYRRITIRHILYCKNRRITNRYIFKRRGMPIYESSHLMT